MSQPLDQFIIKEVRRVWHQEWDEERQRRVLRNDFSEQSGKLNHPSRYCYMRLAAHCIARVNSVVCEDGVSLPRKAMIVCWLSCDLDGVRRKEQLSHQLQQIVTTYDESFNGLDPDA